MCHNIPLQDLIFLLWPVVLFSDSCFLLSIFGKISVALTLFTQNMSIHMSLLPTALFVDNVSKSSINPAIDNVSSVVFLL